MVRLIGPRFPTYRQGWAVKRPLLRMGKRPAEWPIFSGDVVTLLNGPEAGRMGMVRHAYPLRNQVAIEGIRIHKRHLPNMEREEDAESEEKKKGSRPTHGIRSILGKVFLRDLALVDPVTKTPCSIVFRSAVCDSSTGAVLAILREPQPGIETPRLPRYVRTVATPSQAVRLAAGKYETINGETFEFDPKSMNVTRVRISTVSGAIIERYLPRPEPYSG